jgi:GDP/UDP-N,N'-diacetylbacillosamine 2-epimerase (hydrolysing)
MKVCVVTGTRAEYGLLKPLLNKLSSDSSFNLQLLVTGAHLSPEFGLTYKEIEKDGFSINAKVEMLLSSDTSEGIVKSMGLGMIGFADAFKNLLPDLIIILGDRYEMLAATSAALIFGIPVAHLFGGEITEGAYDDYIRHAITKMSYLHFAATEEYRQRIIQLGEQPENVYNFGAIGLDNIAGLKLLNKKELAEDLKIKFKQFTYLVTFHPETLADQSPAMQFNTLLSVIDRQEHSFFIFTKANADTGGRVINSMIDKYVETNPDKSVSFTSMGVLRYLSAMQFVAAVVGNSSSGIVEAPSFRVPTINIGNRQKGRIQAKSIINADCNQAQLESAFKLSKDLQFIDSLKTVVNPYGQGNAASQIVDVLKKSHFKPFQTKPFFNIINEFGR